MTLRITTPVTFCVRLDLRGQSGSVGGLNLNACRSCDCDMFFFAYATCSLALWFALLAFGIFVERFFHVSLRNVVCISS